MAVSLLPAGARTRSKLAQVCLSTRQTSNSLFIPETPIKLLLRFSLLLVSRSFCVFIGKLKTLLVIRKKIENR